MALTSSRDPESIGAERRVSRPYPVNAEVEFKLTSGEKGGAYRRARLVSLSTTDLTLECDTVLQEGLEIELMIKWPACRGRGPEIILHAVGRTVRTDGNRTAVGIDRSNFQYFTPAG